MFLLNVAAVRAQASRQTNLFRRMISKIAYVHPLSEACIAELKKVSPPWFNPALVAIHPSDGTFRLPVRHEKVSDIVDGELSTVYDAKSRHHYLVLKFGQLVGRVSLMDGSKSAWQANIGDDLARVPYTVRELCARIEDASNGIIPDENSANTSRDGLRPPAPAPIFPFPDNVRPPEG